MQKVKTNDDVSSKDGHIEKSQLLLDIPKLVDAFEAGSETSYECTLILTQGDSGKTFVLSGLDDVKRQRYGVYPICGKFLNVRDASHNEISQNVEISNIMKIFGLQYKKKYLTIDDLKTLRYGKVLILTDHFDGVILKGLLINFFHTNWPELLRLPFIEQLNAPLASAVKNDEKLSFYSWPEFEEWKNTRNHITYSIRQNIGLGNLTAEEAREYFNNMERHRVIFKYGGPEDDKCLEMAFSKKYDEQRKIWMREYMEKNIRSQTSK